MRLFPRPGSRASQRPKEKVSVRILLSNNGAVMMRTLRVDSGPRDGIDAPQYADSELSGEIEIRVPRGAGRQRCRCIRVMLRQVTRLHMGEKRGWERDTLFERMIENRGAIILEEGVQRFKFTISVPYGVAGFVIHPKGDVRLSLIAEVQGLSGAAAAGAAISEVPAGGYLWRIRRGSGGSDSSCSTPTPEEGPPNLDIRPAMTVSWNDPVVGTDEEVPWMEGTVRNDRCVCLVYNPNPTGGVTALDMLHNGSVDGLGVFTNHFVSDVWTVCALLKTTLTIPAPSPATTVYYVRVVLEQTAAIRSPRDSEATPPTVTMTPFMIWEKGVRPGSKMGGHGAPAIWRGRAAGGGDADGLSLSVIGRLPNDETGRPSTEPGAVTPIAISHRLVLEIFYSLEGEDIRGNPLPKHAPVAVRLLRAEKPVFIPSCVCIPETIELPTYDATLLDNCVCGVCGLAPNEQVCRACDLTSLLHPRHDLAFEGGTCPECEKRFLQSDEKSKWANCACGLNVNDMVERMARVIPPDVESVGDCLTDRTIGRKPSN